MPRGTQNQATTENGAYDLTRVEAVAENLVTRRSGARYFLPSENEWYKAAYHDPRQSSAGGPPENSRYWLFPTSSQARPLAEPPPGVGNSANYIYSVNGGSLTEVGAYTATSTYYGLFDCAGNAWEWNEGIAGSSGQYRALRGSAWFLEITLEASGRWGGNPAYENFPGVGFRVASQ